MKTDSIRKRRALSFLMVLTVILSMISGIVPEVYAEDYQSVEGKAIYDQIAGMGDVPPQDWYSDKDPYGYGKEVPFFLNKQQELFMLKSKGVSGGVKITSYDTFESENDGYPFRNAKKTWNKDIGGHWTLSFSRSVAFDPTGSGRKDHVAIIGVYASKTKDPKNNPPIIYVWVVDKNGRTSDLVKLSTASWMANKDTYNNENMWDFNAMNFIGITAGDYNGDKKESLVVWECADTPTLKQIDVNVTSSSIKLNILSGDGYPDEDGGALFLKPYSNIKDTYVYDRIHAAIDTGDINGDGIDDLVVLSYVNRVDDDYRKKVTQYYLPSISVSYGIKGSSTSIVEGKSAARQKYACWSDGYEWRIAPAAAGLAVGDVNGDGRDEAVVAGFYHKIKGVYGQTVENAYHTFDRKKLVVGVYGVDMREISFETDLATNEWTRGGDVYGGLFLKDSTEGDHSWQQTGVETVAINGPGNPEHIFINGDLFMLTGSSIKKVYAPDYFAQTDTAMDGMFLEETYVRSMAVGNFDGNDQGYEQIAFILGAADTNNVGNVKYTQGMIGGVYKKNGSVSLTAVDYYCTDSASISDKSKYYPSSSSSCEVDDVLSYDICAWDNDSDGLRVQYIGKAFNYTDPTVMAVLQAPPYFKELKGAMTGYDTSYTISTSYSYAKGEGNSTSFSIGGELEVEAEVVKVNAGLSYATNWEKSFTDELTVSDEYTFTAIGEDQVVLYRTPVTTYVYQVEVKGQFSDKNTITLSFPGVPAKALMSLKKYNTFVDYYNTENKRRAQEAGFDGNVPQLKKINDKYLGHAGDPFSYRNANDDLGGVTLLQSTPNAFEIGSSSTGFAWSQEHSHSEEETSEHGFNFDLSVMFQVRSPVGHTGVGVAINTSLEYMHSTSTSETNAKGKGISCEVGNMDPEGLDEMGIPWEIANQYGFSYQMATWSSGLKTIENLEDWETEDEDNKTKVVDVPIYGYVLSGVKSATIPVDDLEAEFDTDENNDMFIRLTWSDPGTEERPVGAYVIYLDEKDGSMRQVTTLPAGTTEYSFKDLDGRDRYSFTVRTKPSMDSYSESVDSERAFVYLGANAIYSIELTSSTETTDTYTLTQTDGTKFTLVVRHGIGIKDVSLSETSSDGLTDTYKITFTDGSEKTFEIKNGGKPHEMELRTVDVTDPATGNTKKMLQWRYIALEGEEEYSWKDLVEVTEAEFVKGKDGSDGREVELQVNKQEGTIQWRYAADETGNAEEWIDLISLEELTGDKGEQGEKGEQGDPGREIELRIDQDTHTVQWHYITPEGEPEDEWKDLYVSSEDGWLQGEPGDPGEDGREVELQKNPDTGDIEWRYAASEGQEEDTWKVLVESASLRGETGETGKDAREIELQTVDEIDTKTGNTVRTIQWRYIAGEGEEQEDWTDLITLEELTAGRDGRDGVDARDPEFRMTEKDDKTLWVQWRYVASGGNPEEEWKDLYHIPSPDSLRGEPGRGIVSFLKTSESGLTQTYTITYTDGTTTEFSVMNGARGADGRNGSDASIVTDRISSSYGTDGVDGADGISGKDGTGIADVRIVDGFLIVTLTDGREINAGSIVSETQVMKTEGEVRNYYFNTSSKDISQIVINGKELSSEYYTIKTYGEGTLITISEKAIPAKDGEIRVVTTGGTSTLKLSDTPSSVPMWLIYALLGWNTLLTGGFVALAVNKRKSFRNE